MTLTLSDLDFLASDAGINLLESLAHDDLADSNTLPLLTHLRKTYSPDESAAALEMARLRIKAAAKFGPDAARMFFTRDALEQASDPHIRHYRAPFVQGKRVIDACCGIGGDTLALARTAQSVLGLDNDPLRVAIARHNADVLGLKNLDFQTGDVTESLPDADFIFFDPARRDASGKRIHDVERYIPPLSTVNNWRAPQITVKLSPGVDLAQLESYPGKVEFISVNGDLKEALLWLDGESCGLSATLLIDDAIHHWNESDSPAAAPLSEPLAWLVEPDPAILRAGLVQDVALAFAGHMLDETIAYFTTESCPDSPWLRAWKIVDWMPFHLKKLRAYLRERNVGQITVKKRGSPLTPEALIAKLKLKGDDKCLLILTRLQGAPIVIICADEIP